KTMNINSNEILSRALTLSTIILQNPIARQRVLPVNLNLNDLEQYISSITSHNRNLLKDPRRIMGFHLCKANVKKEGERQGEEHPRVLEIAARMVWMRCNFGERNVHSLGKNIVRERLRMVG
ncbi:6539_t:CDS:1, partial [Dentiscutata erythropus]